MFNKNDKLDLELKDKIIEIEAGIEGNVKFTAPMNLRISGKFDGELETKGNLIIGDKADVKAKIMKGDDIKIEGRVKGNIICSKRLELTNSARVIGNVETPILVMAEGAKLKGGCLMSVDEERKESSSKKKEEA